jgi:hypothetical protein
MDTSIRDQLLENAATCAAEAAELATGGDTAGAQALSEVVGNLVEAAYLPIVAGTTWTDPKPGTLANPIVIKVESCTLGALPTAQARERVRIQGIVREELARTFRDARYAQRVAYSEMGRSDGTIPPTGGPITG